MPAGAPLDSLRIVATAILLIEEVGPRQLTMRAVAVRLEVNSMALYHYFPSKGNLLQAVVESLVSAADHDIAALSSPTCGWQEFLLQHAHAMRRNALTHPVAFPLIATVSPVRSWLSPPLQSPATAENILAGLLSEGFSEVAAVSGYRALAAFLLGHLLLEVADQPHKAVTRAPAPGAPRTTGLPPTLRAPTVERLRGDLVSRSWPTEFDDSLEMLLRRIGRIRSRQ